MINRVRGMVVDEEGVALVLECRSEQCVVGGVGFFGVARRVQDAVDIHANPIGINCPTILSTILNKETDLHPHPS